MDANTTTIVVAVISAIGVGGIGREIIAGLGKIRRGVAVKESVRKDDLVSARELALERAIAAEQREQGALMAADKERANRYRTDAYAAKLERELNLRGIPLPASPMLEDTITPAELRAITEEIPTHD